MFERDDGRALGDSFVERANLKSHLILRYVLIICSWIRLPIRVDHQVLVFLLELQVFNLDDVPHFAVKGEPFGNLDRILALNSSILIRKLIKRMSVFALFLNILGESIQFLSQIYDFTGQIPFGDF